MRLPTGYRLWEHVGTRIKPDGFSVLDGSKITIPQVMDAYVEPSAYQSFKKTGKWPEGTQIVKEYSLVKTGPDCNTTTFVCSTRFGRGVFEERYAGLGMMIKDSRLFPLTAGNWGYFSFLPAGTRYQLIAGARPREQCSSCHEKGAAETDYVFSKSHIGLLPGNMQ
ncbi:MAG: cytochrome P460 family protein [Bryobacteraceae bacterium]